MTEKKAEVIVLKLNPYRHIQRYFNRELLIKSIVEAALKQEHIEGVSEDEYIK